MKLRNCVIVDGVRTPFSKGGRGKLEATRMDDLGALLIKTMLDRNPQIKPTMIDDFGIGHGGNDQTIAGLGTVAQLAGLPAETCNFHTNRQCGSSMETSLRVAMGIILGSYDCGIGLGGERMGRTMGSGMPRGGKPNRVQGFNPNRKRSQMQRDMAHDHFEYFSVPIPDPILDSQGASMVQSAQNVSEMYHLTRQECDAFSMRSQHKLAKAYATGIYKKEVLSLTVEDPVFNENQEWVPEEKGPMVTFDTDESLRANTTMEGLAKLKPVAGIMSLCGTDLIITAGNSCPTNVGMTAVLLMSEDMALKLGLDPLCRIIGWAVGGVKQAIMGVGPVVAIKKALRHAGLTMDQINRVEFNEAFSHQVIPTMKETGMKEEVLNVNGGSIGIGHPIGATGARLLGAIGHEIKRSGKRYGMATQCIGAGQGIATIVESMDAR